MLRWANCFCTAVIPPFSFIRKPTWWRKRWGWILFASPSPSASSAKFRTTENNDLGDIRPSQLSDPKLFDFLALGHRDGATLPDAHAWLASEPHADSETQP